MNSKFKKLVVALCSVFIIVGGSYGVMAVLGFVSTDNLSETFIVLAKVCAIIFVVVMAVIMLLQFNKE